MKCNEQARSYGVTLSPSLRSRVNSAKGLARGAQRCFASLSMTTCMDYGHHDSLHAHRVYSLQAVERPPQPLCDDDGKPGDDDGNPYTTPYRSWLLHFIIMP